MSRYCSIARYKCYLDNVKSIKEVTPRKFLHIQDVNFGDSNRMYSSGLWNKIMKGFADASNLPKTTEVLSTCSRKSESENVSTPKMKSTRMKLFKKEFQKACSTIQKKLSNERGILLCSASVSAVNPTPTNDLSAELTSKLASKSSDGVPVEPIPEPPVVPEGVEEVINQVNALGEPTLASLGLGGYTPVGIVQNCLEYLHADFGVPWWGAIAIGTLVIRICLFPLVVIAQRNAAKMNNYLPQMQAIQMKLTEARQSGNSLDAARYTQELMLFMKEKNLNPFKNMLVPLAQMPVFISFFMALRQMCNVPVESLRTGGLWWFTDLTLPDQYFILPLITSATLLATIELGTDTAKLSAQNMVLMKYVLRSLPIIILPFTVNFPGAILCYWVSTNFISLIQVGFLRLPRVREYFKIEQMKKFDPTTLPIKPKGFREGLKESWTNIKITKELEERRRLDEIQFRRAGKGPIQKTYKYDPTKQVTDPGTAAPMSAKKR